MHIVSKYFPNLALKNETQLSVADVIPSKATNFFVLAAVAGEYYIPYVGNNAGNFSFLSFDAHSATNRTILLRASSDFSAYTRNTYVILAYYTETL